MPNVSSFFLIPTLETLFLDFRNYMTASFAAVSCVQIGIVLISYIIQKRVAVINWA